MDSLKKNWFLIGMFFVAILTIAVGSLIVKNEIKKEVTTEDYGNVSFICKNTYQENVKKVCTEITKDGLITYEDLYVLNEELEKHSQTTIDGENFKKEIKGLK